MLLYQLGEKLFFSYAKYFFFFFFSVFAPFFIKNFASLERKILQKSESTKCKSKILELFLLRKFLPMKPFVLKGVLSKKKWHSCNCQCEIFSFLIHLEP